jgi:hypothetical protein
MHSRTLPHYFLESTMRYELAGPLPSETCDGYASAVCTSLSGSSFGTPSLQFDMRSLDDLSRYTIRFALIIDTLRYKFTKT